MTIDAARAIADGTWPEISARLDAEDSARHQRLTSATALAEAAAWYCSRGVAVFPLRPRMKLPAIPSAHPVGDPLRGTCTGVCGKQGHGFYDATTDQQEVAYWWRKWPQANIGAPTGITFDVIDVDGPVGIRSLAGGAIDYVTALRERSIGLVSTPRPGGLHYFIPPGERTNTASKIMPGVDTRGAGGYVVLPPSVTDEHGPDRRYTWLRPLGSP